MNVARGWISIRIAGSYDFVTSDHVPVAELCHRQCVRALVSADELVRLGTFESDEELEEFLADLNLSRRTDLA
jgi:hypothetical protein